MMACIDHGRWCDKDGYTEVLFDGGKHKGHRVVYCIANGLRLVQIKGLVVRHECDNPRCVNPEHLLLGTHADNMRDKVSRGRTSKPPKLQAHEVREIRRICSPSVVFGKGRKNPHGYAGLAKKYGVSPGVIHAVHTGKTYKDVAP